MIGAKYGVYDSNNNLVETLIIGDDCSATTNYLPFGKYKVKELSASTGYNIDTNIYDVNITDINIVEVISKENVIRGKIRIKKVDSETNSCKAHGNASLKGAKYGIYDSNNNLVDTLIIGDDCTATSKYLPYAKYQIREISAPVGYELDTKVYDIYINVPNIIDVISNENVIKGKVKIKKVDSETNSCNAKGQATLIGARYGLYDINNNLIDTLIIGEDCTAESQNIPFGNYKIKELFALNGYELDTKVYDINIINTNTIEIISKEKVIKNFISILKQYDFVDETTQFLNAESDVTFEIYYPDGTLYDKIVTDKNGYATIEIPYGVWKFHQVNSHIGFEKIYDFFITVDENSPKDHYYNILNNKLSAYLKVVKIDSETGNTIAIANTTFKILNTDTNQYVSQFVAGKVYDTFKTDANGIMTTYLKLESGNYRLIEIESPNGYLLSSESLNFSIGEDTHYSYTNYGAFVTVYFKNTAIKGQVEINKKGENLIVNNGSFSYEYIDLDNVVFEIYASEDVKSSDGNYLYYNKDDLVDTITTDEFGYAISKELPLGKYYIVEIKTKEDYVLDNEKYYFELTEIDNKTPMVYHTYSALNMLKKGTIEFSKTDLVDGKPIPNTIIEIYNSAEELIFTGKTDVDGEIIINNLKIGKYYIIEKESATGYILSDEKVYFEIKENGEIVKVNMTNEKITGTLEFTKIDLVGGKPIPNTIIEIYNSAEELIFTGKTDVDGKIIIDNLTIGKYYIIEKESATGYILSDEKVYFEIKENGEIVKANMTNEKIVEVPNTNLNDSRALNIVGGIFFILGVAYLIYDNKKQKK